ncbi:DUF4179 domain-containing protein [Brevibacillus sp. 179-C9.3 HS]|uniref:DUF4179 domain-containing protein n=1 Tax=unclassified Brevibacillus TaxID=2684853 RepID=UPI0039A373C3
MKKQSLKSISQLLLATVVGLTGLAAFSGEHASALQPSVQKGAADVTRLITAVNQSVNVNGITVTINKIFYDGIRLDISYSILLPKTTEKAAAANIAKKIVLHDITLIEPTADNNKVSASSGSYVNQIDDFLFAGVITTTLEGDWPDQFTFQGVIVDDGNAQNYWNVEIPVEKQKTGRVILTPNNSQTLRSKFSIQVKEVTVTPVSTSIALKEMAPDSKQYKPSYSLYTPQGKSITILDASTYEEDEHGVSRILVLPTIEKSEYIQLVPYMNGIAEVDKAIKIPLKK